MSIFVATRFCIKKTQKVLSDVNIKRIVFLLTKLKAFWKVNPLFTSSEYEKWFRHLLNSFGDFRIFVQIETLTGRLVDLMSLLIELSDFD